MDVIHIDDNPADRKLMKLAFDEAGSGIRYIPISDGTAAVEYLETLAPDFDPYGKVFLIDVNMPRIDGIEIVQKIRADKRTRTIPVVMLSSSGQQIDRQSALMHGALEYVVKPSHFDKWIEFAQAIHDKYL